MGVVAWVLLGLIAGFLARRILPGATPRGFLRNGALGVGGALLGGLIAKVAFDTALDEFWSWESWVMAVVGAMLVLTGYRALVGKSRARRR